MPTHNDSTHTDRLIEASLEGGDGSLGALMERHRDYLRRVVELRMDPPLAARIDPSDIVQETQLIASRRLQEFIKQRPCSFRVWLRQHALQQLIGHRRTHLAQKRSMNKEIALSDVSSMAIARNLLQGTPSKILQRRELQDQIRAAIESLNEKDREVILLRYIEDLSNGEVAEVLGIEADTASKRHGRAVRRLCVELSKAGFTYEP